MRGGLKGYLLCFAYFGLNLPELGQTGQKWCTYREWGTAFLHLH